MDLQILEKEKIKRFMLDKTMSNAVRKVLEHCFMSKKNPEVHYLAAKSLSLEFLDDAFKELKRIGSVEESQNKSVNQIGL